MPEDKETPDNSTPEKSKDESPSKREGPPPPLDTPPDTPPQEVVKEQANMSVQCAHSFQLIKSETNLIEWYCQHCRDGPRWNIFECTYCQLKLCQPCSQRAS